MHIENHTQEKEKHHMQLIDAAKICHETLNAYRDTIGERTYAWDSLPEWKQESIMAGVLYVLEDPIMRPKALHAAWVAQMALSGWSFGPVMDPEYRKHPGMRDYDELDGSQQTKDRIFISVVNAMRSQIRHCEDADACRGRGCGANFAGLHVGNMNIYQH